uniref:Coiled-coil domain containing 33 n=1 Tax=Calidris pygmaea TaxID=425635 RepID=A0A8C3J0I0_9CHAR
MCPSQGLMLWRASCPESSLSHTGWESCWKSGGMGAMPVLQSPSSHPPWGGFLLLPMFSLTASPPAPMAANRPSHLPLRFPPALHPQPPQHLPCPLPTPKRLPSPTEGSPAKVFPVFLSIRSSWPRLSPRSLLCRSQEVTGDQQEPEVGSYRLALKRMAGDLLSLRQHVTSLEVENGHLRRSLASQEELGHSLLADVDLDVMTREELLDRLATLKRKLVASTAEMKRLKDRVQQLQNELIRKNDREKDLLLLQRAHQQQQATLRRCQGKVAKTKGLEETVRQQEKVIEAMERVLQEKLTGATRSTEKPVGGCKW